MDNKIVDIILTRIDKLEEKIDSLLAYRWKLAGTILTVTVVFSIIFQIGLAFIERH